MPVIKKKRQQRDDKVWEDPANPEAPTDARDLEQIKRQFNEVKRINDSLAKDDKLAK